mmetsp:Transcript_82515/g.246052  ORF Transcript_82515/g.246052 Transcript_82515/m.246052 type:complete len:225 (+) Transcript_82515:589-1263(+)
MCRVASGHLEEVPADRHLQSAWAAARRLSWLLPPAWCPGRAPPTAATDGILQVAKTYCSLVGLVDGEEDLPEVLGLIGPQLLRQQLQHSSANPGGVRVPLQGPQGVARQHGHVAGSCAAGEPWVSKRFLRAHPLLGVLVEKLLQEVNRVVRHGLPTALVAPVGLPGLYLCHHKLLIPVERRVAREQHPDNDAEAPQVALVRVPLPLQDVWADVGDGPTRGHHQR